MLQQYNIATIKETLHGPKEKKKKQNKDLNKTNEQLPSIGWGNLLNQQ